VSGPETARSADGTRIVYERQGEGLPPLILVDGAFTLRRSNAKPGLFDALAARHPVVIYDRRGRGDSGDTLPYAVEREIEDLAALLEVVGGRAALFGHSSGAALVLRTAAALGDRVTHLVLYEAPYNDAPQARAAFTSYVHELETALSEGRRGDAAAAFMAYVGTPSEQIADARTQPYFAGLEAVAHTLHYDHTEILGPENAVPEELARHVTAPALVLYGTRSFPFMKSTAERLASVLPNATLRPLPDQTHDIQPAVLVPVMEEFFSSSARQPANSNRLLLADGP
jgi:pimeloyl-ACP methyl ester carboxylesterase